MGVFVAGTVFFLYVFGLDFGTPDWTHSLAVFESRENIQKLSPKLLRLREEIYSQYKDVNVDAMGGQPASWEKVSQTMVFNAMRSHLTQPMTSDETQVTGALSRFRLDPFHYFAIPMTVYGFTYLGSMGVFLGAAHLLGFVTLTPDIGFYFLHPEQVRRAYVLCRLFSALCVWATLFFLYPMVRCRWGWKAAAFACLLYASHPVSVVMGHFTKPWSLGALWTTLILFFCLRIVEGSQKRSDLLAAGVFSGLAGGTIYAYSLTWLWIPLAYVASGSVRARGWRYRDLLASALLGAGIFFLTSPQVLFNFKGILRIAQAQKIGIPLGGYLLFNFKDTFLTTPGIFYLPLLALSAWFSWRSKDCREQFLWAAFLSAFICFGAIMLPSTHHLLQLYPLAAMLCFFGVRHFPEQQFMRGLAVSLAGVALAASLAVSLVWLSNIREDNLRVSGQWISENVPKGASIGITEHIPSVTFPSFPYLRYQFWHAPGDESRFPISPDYVIHLGNKQPAFAGIGEFTRRYRLAFYLPPPRVFIGDLNAADFLTRPPVAESVHVWRRWPIIKP